MATSGSKPSPLRIIVGSDNAGHSMKEMLEAEMEKNPGVSKVIDIGVHDAKDSNSYPNIAVEAGKRIMAGEVNPSVSFIRSGD